MASHGPASGQDLSEHEPPVPPPIAAAFYVEFDVRKGYTIAWQRAKDGLELDGVVEYKSLPSGLHNVEEDLVYFVHEDYAGVSAFLNQADPDSERNARMLAVGVLVPLDQGRMGKSWRHADALKNLARQLIKRPDDFEQMERYWNEQKASDERADGEDAQTDASMVIVDDGKDDGAVANGNKSSRRLSTASVAYAQTQALSSHHPALSLAGMLQLFGPLLFPLYRAALLRKRVLFLTEVPVESACDYVYDLSVLSSLPTSLLHLLPVDGTPSLRLKALFNVSVLDIPQLNPSRRASQEPDLDRGWIACTTDDVLATKPELFDLLVMLPSTESLQANPKSHPKLVPSSPELSRTFAKVGIRATQRDARQHLRLWSGLTHIASPKAHQEPTSGDEDDAAESVHSTALSTISHRSIVEPASWSLIAYTSLVWWASAGEKRLGLLEEEESEVEHDAQLLDLHEEDINLTKEVAIVAYFHRLTSTIFSTISDAIARTDREDYHDEEDEQSQAEPGANNESAIVDSTNGPEDEQPLLSRTKASATSKNRETVAAEDSQEYESDPIEITEEDMRLMALDIWSARDREFMEDLIWLWWGRKVDIRGGRVECCGVRIL